MSQSQVCFSLSDCHIFKFSLPIHVIIQSIILISDLAILYVCLEYSLPTFTENTNWVYSPTHNVDTIRGYHVCVLLIVYFKLIH